MLHEKKKVRDKEKLKEIEQQILLHYGKEILMSENFEKTSEYMQHGHMSVRQHCINVAKYSLMINDMLGIHCQRRDLIRGALLHDYFLYDWHDKERIAIKRLHGFYHPGIAFRNASEEYRLSPREEDIIKKHMWPLTIKPPLCREAWVVTSADKLCSLLETLHIQKEESKKRRKKHYSDLNLDRER